MLRQFRLPIVVSLSLLLLSIVIGFIGLRTIEQTGATPATVRERSRQLATGLGAVTAIVAAPFWVSAAGKAAQFRRDAPGRSRGNSSRRRRR